VKRIIALGVVNRRARRAMTAAVVTDASGTRVGVEQVNGGVRRGAAWRPDEDEATFTVGVARSLTGS
jgi:hypothetical protein